VTCNQQHHIRNGVISIRRILRWLDQNTSLTAAQRSHLRDAIPEAERVELYACDKGTCEEKIKEMATEEAMKMTGWKTKTGGWLALATGITAAAAEAVPLEEAKPWLKLAAAILGGASMGLMGTGIGHKIEKAK
jgi:hypothetical protein